MDMPTKSPLGREEKFDDTSWHPYWLDGLRSQMAENSEELKTDTLAKSNRLTAESRPAPSGYEQDTC